MVQQKPTSETHPARQVNAANTQVHLQVMLVGIWQVNTANAQVHLQVMLVKIRQVNSVKIQVHLWLMLEITQVNTANTQVHLQVMLAEIRQVNTANIQVFWVMLAEIRQVNTANIQVHLRVMLEEIRQVNTADTQVHLWVKLVEIYMCQRHAASSSTSLVVTATQMQTTYCQRHVSTHTPLRMGKDLTVLVSWSVYEPQFSTIKVLLLQIQLISYPPPPPPPPPRKLWLCIKNYRPWINWNKQIIPIPVT